ncbi:hypothetical protein HDU81_002124 [Chytriomyces hyalinus]|nr:hypothetical protein HDU81_002124 [Chytriomyces hyalinus]
MSPSLLPLMELRSPAAGAAETSLIVVIIPLPKLAPGLCSKALDFIKSLPRSSERPEKVQVMLCQNRRHSPRLVMELSAPMHLTFDGFKHISSFLSNAGQQPSRSFFLPRKTAKIAKAFAHANDLHLNEQLKRLAIFCDGFIQFKQSEMAIVKAQLLRMYQEKVVPQRFADRLHIAVKCESTTSQHCVDCETTGFQMSLNPLISNFRGLTPLIFGFSGAGKSSFVNSVNFIATSSTRMIATGNYDGQVTLCLNTIPIGTNGDITVVDSVGMTTGENEVSFLGDEFKLILQNQMPLNVFWRDMIGAEFGAAMLNQSAVLQYQHMNPEKMFTFTEKRVNCVLGVVSLGLLESTAVKKKMTKVAHKLTSEFGE